MKIEIKHRWSNAILFAVEAASWRIALELAVGSKANLCGANLRGANLCGANLRGANLRGADLCEADLCEANLCEADLREADLRGADLCEADLGGANLRGADLCEANLCEANLRGADLGGANLCEAKNAALAVAMTVIVPEGDLIVWKKCRDAVIVKLLVPRDAKRSSASGRKCRAEFADPLEVFGAEIGISKHDGKTEYRPGVRVACHEWNEDRWVECGGGIHFFLTREEAEAY
jgi:hypothetical protein